MKLIVALCLVAVAVAAPPPSTNYPQDSKDVQILKFENDNVGFGKYGFAFEQSDGTAHEQQGQIINEGKEDEFIAVKGSFIWIDPNGVTYRINYIADDKGFQPEIEQGPGGGVPPAVVASLLG